MFECWFFFFTFLWLFFKNQPGVKMKNIMFDFFEICLFIMFFQDYCTGIKNNNEEFIITSRIPYLNHLTFTIIECLLMIFLILNKFLQIKFRDEKKIHIRFWVLFILFIINVFTDVIWWFYIIPFQFNLFIRPIFLSLYQYFFII